MHDGFDRVPHRHEVAEARRPTQLAAPFERRHPRQHRRLRCRLAVQEVNDPVCSRFDGSDPLPVSREQTLGEDGEVGARYDVDRPAWPEDLRQIRIAPVVCLYPVHSGVERQQRRSRRAIL